MIYSEGLALCFLTFKGRQDEKDGFFVIDRAIGLCG